MKLHSIIVDDESSSTRALKILLEKIAPEVKVVCICNNPAEAVDAINSFRPDLVFLDVRMPEIDGFQLLDKLEFKRFQLIFCTAYKEFALRAIKHHATDYLLKPIDPVELRETLDRAIKNLESAVIPDLTDSVNTAKRLIPQRVPLPVKGNVIYVQPNEIIYIEADSNRAAVKLVNGECESVSMGLKEYEELLCENIKGFIRIHHSFIINIEHTSKYLKKDGGYAVMADNKTIPISKNRIDEFLKIIRAS